MPIFSVPRRKLNCKRCGKKVAYKSRRGLCYDCSIKANKESVKQLKAKKGKIYDKWRKRLLGALAA